MGERAALVKFVEFRGCIPQFLKEQPERGSVSLEFTPGPYIIWSVATFDVSSLVVLRNPREPEEG